MPFTLNFYSQENTEILDIAFLEELAKCNGKNKITKLVFDSNYNQVLPKLPIYIKKVVFGFHFTKDITGIGDHIECLEFSVHIFNFNLASFPKNLKELIIKADKIEAIDLENIPPSVEKVLIQCPEFNKELILESTNIKYLTINSLRFNKPLDKLPRGLLELRLDCSIFDQLINSLPSGLEKLYISSRLFNQRMDNLPLSLKEFTMQDMEAFTLPLDSLPIGIENLDLHFGFQTENKYSHNISNLVHCKKMRLGNYWGDLNLLPDSIEELDLWFPPHKCHDARNHIKNWFRIPSNLKILDVNREMARMKSIHNFTDTIKANIQCDGICLNGAKV